jgi:hypothetical protein
MMVAGVLSFVMRLRRNVAFALRRSSGYRT